MPYLGGMANFRLGVALASSVATALVLLQLFSLFQHQSQPLIVGTQSKWAHRAAVTEANNDDIFLLGAGKADITG